MFFSKSIIFPFYNKMVIPKKWLNIAKKVTIEYN